MKFNAFQNHLPRPKLGVLWWLPATFRSAICYTGPECPVACRRSSPMCRAESGQKGRSCFREPVAGSRLGAAACWSRWAASGTSRAILPTAETGFRDTSISSTHFIHFYPGLRSRRRRVVVTEPKFLEVRWGRSRKIKA